jgi:hypothetical protein
MAKFCFAVIALSRMRHKTVERRDAMPSSAPGVSRLQAEFGTSV